MPNADSEKNDLNEPYTKHKNIIFSQKEII